MKRILTLIVAVALVGACTRDVDTPAPSAGPGEGAAGRATCAPELDGAFAAWADAGFSGTVAVSTAGRFDCLAGYGLADQEEGEPNTPDTVFSIGSVSKAFTAAAILSLVDEGTIALDGRAGDLVTGLRGPAAEATVEQLLLHTSGLTGAHGQDHEPLARDEAVAAISGLERVGDAGSGEALYSNAGYTLLALIVEEATDGGYRDHVASNILALPGGATAGGFWDGEPAAPGPGAVGYLDDGSAGQRGDFAGPHWALDGNGDLAMTTGDLAAWTHALFTGEVVSPGSVEVISRPAVDEGGGRWGTPGWVAFDESVYGEPLLAAAGGGGDTGHDAVVAWLPASGRVIALASNTATPTAEEVLRSIIPAFVAGEPLPGPDGPVAGDGDGEGETEDETGGEAGAGAAVAGTYALGAGGTFEVRAGDDGPVVTGTGPDAVAALWPPSLGFTTDDLAAHEQAVLEALAGETSAGREELEVLEDDLGPIEGVEPIGTIVDGGEVRTYVTVTTAGGPTVIWYALDEAGAIAGALIVDAPPTLRLVPDGDGGYRPEDPAGTGPDLAVSFDGARMTVTGPAGVTVAARRGS